MQSDDSTCLTVSQSAEFDRMANSIPRQRTISCSTSDLLK
jgi:hypothetical protein